MNYKCGLFMLCVVVFGCRPDNESDLTWYKGNLHTHTYWSDGDEFPEMVLDWYPTPFHGISRFRPIGAPDPPGNPEHAPAPRTVCRGTPWHLG